MMDSFRKQIGPKLDARHYSIITRAIDAEIAENGSQVIRMALREFEKNHGIEVKKI
jgi:hypothetical protein